MSPTERLLKPTEESDVACTLSAERLEERLAAIADLNRTALRGHSRDDLALDLAYSPDAAARVREMVRRERECCAFLDFDVREDANSVRVRITAPEAARDAAASLFEEFISTAAKSKPACGCA